MQAPLFDFESFIGSKGPDRLVMVLEAIPAEKLLVVLEREHWTGMKGYSARGMWSALVAGLLYGCSTVAERARDHCAHDALQGPPHCLSAPSNRQPSPISSTAQCLTPPLRAYSPTILTQNSEFRGNFGDPSGCTLGRRWGRC